MFISKPLIIRADVARGVGLGDQPLDSPAHGNVGDDEWRGEEEDLVRESSPGIEDSCVESTSKRALSVGAHGE
jgi:hypothetical protein